MTRSHAAGLKLLDGPCADAGALGQRLLGQPGRQPILTEQRSEPGCFVRAQHLLAPEVSTVRWADRWRSCTTTGRQIQIVRDATAASTSRALRRPRAGASGSLPGTHFT